MAQLGSPGFAQGCPPVGVKLPWRGAPCRSAEASSRPGPDSAPALRDSAVRDGTHSEWTRSTPADGDGRGGVGGVGLRSFRKSPMD